MSEKREEAEGMQRCVMCGADFPEDKWHSCVPTVRAPAYAATITVKMEPCPECGQMIAQGVWHLCTSVRIESAPVSRAEFDALRADVYRLLEHAGMPK